MKNNHRHLFRVTSLVRVLLLSTIILSLMSTTVMASSSVIYKNQAERFVYLPASKDLFQNFKNVMPGDTRLQDIDLENKSGGPIKISLKMVAPSNTDRAFLNLFTLEILNGSSNLYSSPAGETAQLTNSTTIATLQPGAKVTLKLKLHLPITVTDSAAGLSGEVKWEFTAEEVSKPTSTTGKGTIESILGSFPKNTVSRETRSDGAVASTSSSPRLPRTGEIGQIPFMGILIVAAFSLIGVLFVQRKR